MYYNTDIFIIFDIFQFFAPNLCKIIQKFSRILCNLAWNLQFSIECLRNLKISPACGALPPNSAAGPLMSSIGECQSSLRALLLNLYMFFKYKRYIWAKLLHRLHVLSSSGLGIRIVSWAWRVFQLTWITVHLLSNWIKAFSLRQVKGEMMVRKFR